VSSRQTSFLDDCSKQTTATNVPQLQRCLFISPNFNSPNPKLPRVSFKLHVGLELRVRVRVRTRVRIRVRIRVMVRCRSRSRVSAN